MSSGRGPSKGLFDGTLAQTTQRVFPKVTLGFVIRGRSRGHRAGERVIQQSLQPGASYRVRAGRTVEGSGAGAVDNGESGVGVRVGGGAVRAARVGRARSVGRDGVNRVVRVRSLCRRSHGGKEAVRHGHPSSEWWMQRRLRRFS